MRESLGIFKSPEEKRVRRALDEAIALLQKQEPEKVLALSRESLELARQVGDRERECGFLILMGQASRELRRFDEALGHLETAAPLATDAEGKGMIHLQRGELLEILGRADEALEPYRAAARAYLGQNAEQAVVAMQRLESLEDAAKGLPRLPPYPPGEGPAHALVGEARQRARERDFGGAIEKATEGVAKAKKLNAPECEFVGLMVMGASHRRLGDLERARTHLFQANQIAGDLKDRERICVSAIELGKVCQEMGENEQARASFELAKSLAEDRIDMLWIEAERLLDDLDASTKARPEATPGSSPPQSAARALLAQGMTLHGDERLPEAVARLTEAAEALRLAGDPGGEGLALYALGSVSFKQEDSERAITYWKKALPLTREAGDVQTEMSLLLFLAERYDAPRRKDAIECGERSLALAREHQEPEVQIAVAGRLAQLYEAEGRPRDGLAVLRDPLELARKTGDRAEEGWILSTKGWLHNVLGEGPQAILALEESLRIRRELGDRSGEAGSLVQLAGALALEGRITEAIARTREALSIEESLHAPNGQTLFALGAFLDIAGRPAEALCTLEEALPVLRQSNDREGEMRTLQDLGAKYRQFGRTEEAMEVLARAGSMARENGDRKRELEIDVRRSAAAYDLGRLQEALDSAERALGIARELRDDRNAATALSNIGTLYARMGRWEEALWYTDQALELRRALGEATSIAASCHSRAMVLHETGATGEALALFEEALALAREAKDVRLERTVLASLTAVLDYLETPAGALRHYDRMIEVAAKTEQRALKAMMLTNLGVIAFMFREAREARAHLEEAVRLSTDAGDRASEMQARAWIGHIHKREGRLPDARREYALAIEAAEALRGEVASPELRTSYFSTMQALYEAYVSLLVEMGDVASAFEAAERGRGRAFLDLLSEATLEVREGIDPHLRDEERRLLVELAAVRARLLEMRQGRENAPSSEVGGLERRYRELELAYQRTEAEIRSRNPRYAALTQPQIWPVSRLQQELLDERTALLEYVLGESRSHLFVLRKDRIDAFVLPREAEIQTKVRELRAAILHGTVARYPHGYELYEMLIKPAEALIRGKDLLVVADGTLHHLPFGLLLTRPPDEESGGGTRGPNGPTRALGDRERLSDEERKLVEKVEVEMAALPPFAFERLPYLTRDYAVSYAPSATVAGIVRSEVRERRASGRPFEFEFTAFADPLTEALELGGQSRSDEESALPLRIALRDARGSLARIPNTAAEAWAIARLFSKSAPEPGRAERFDEESVHVRTGNEATKEALAEFVSGARSSRFFHIASHGLVDAEKPQFSGLVFTPGKSGDLFWQMFEIFNARIPAELVVLSACETGLGRLERGEGLVGLTRAFMYAGAPSLCVSLWKVADESTPPMMRAFYEEMLDGKPKAKALQRAQLRMLDEGLFVHPYYWAPFVLVGEGNS